ncbi:MAG: hypothetical protein Q8O56_04845 [Solirubrobacteraceae bacterium]|nr:hypothetical protein [Solirubrobacteraceae bacterium]
MAEQDPRDYRGGVHEPQDAKGGPDSWADNEGIVPREMVDEPTKDPRDPQALRDPVKGAVTDRDPSDSAIDPSGGDDADAVKGQTGSTVDSADELTEDNATSKWDAANAALGNTGRA